MEIPDRGSIDEETAALLLLFLRQFETEFLQIVRDNGNLNAVSPEFWERFRQRLQDAIEPILRTVFLISANFHNPEDEQDSATQDAAERFSRFHASEVAEQVRETSESIVEDEKETVLTALILAKIIGQIFGEKRAKLIASDAVTTAQSQGGEYAISRANAVSKKDLWVTSADEKVCPICLPLNGKTRDVWEAVSPFGPPAHPACRCFINYERSNNA